MMSTAWKPRTFVAVVKKLCFRTKAIMEKNSVGRPSLSLYAPVVARMRKFLRVGSLTLQRVSATQLGWLGLVAGGPNRLKVPERPAGWLFNIAPGRVSAPFSA